MLLRWLCVLIIVGFGVPNVGGQPSILSCSRELSNRTLTFRCPENATIEKFDIDDLDVASTIDILRVVCTNCTGPLKSIPKNICRFVQLKHLDLAHNQISNAFFRFSSPCLSQLEILDLTKNYLSRVPARLLAQMPKLRIIKLGHNRLTEIPNTMFYNISNVEILDVSHNQLKTFEFWLIQVKTLINYLYNPINRFTNNFNVDLSEYHSTITETILLHNNESKIDFDDSLFEMYNRCGEITSTSTSVIKQAMKIIHEYDPEILSWRCSCEQYYLQRYIVSVISNNDCLTCECVRTPTSVCVRMCLNQSSLDATNVKPRFCELKRSEAGVIPVYSDSDALYLNYLSNAYDLDTISWKTHDKLIGSNLADGVVAYQFAEIIEISDKRIQSSNPRILTPIALYNFQMIISVIETLITSIDTPLDIAVESVAILSLWKNSSIYSYSQIIQNETSFDYSTETNYENYTTTITVDQSSIDILSPEQIYTFYYLPSSLFQFAYEDQSIIIVPPIVGVYLPHHFPRIINISFTDIERFSGRYACVFWQANRWNDSGCSHSFDSKSNRHFCVCYHTTSFALIFIPHKTIHQTYIPSITTAVLSLVCFSISIVLSTCRHAAGFRHLSIANIFTLSNSIILFVLLTVILIQGYQSNEKMTNHCSKSQENLMITTYFFLISAFASKTLLGVCYFLTIFFHFAIIQFVTISNKWFYASFLLVILIALIPTIIINIILKHWKSIFLSYEGICWFNSEVIFQFISIPILVFIGLNILIISGVAIRLLRFSIRRKTNERRMIISLMIWLALCVSLGIGWIFGPFLDVLIRDKNKTSSMVQLWIFGMFIGLEGVWILIVNVIFYVNQKVNKNKRQMLLNQTQN